MKKPSSSSSKPKTVRKKTVRKPTRRKVAKMVATSNIEIVESIEDQPFAEIVDAPVQPIVTPEPSPARIVTMEAVLATPSSLGGLNKETKKIILWGSVTFVMLSIIVGWGATLLATLSVPANNQNDEALSKANEEFTNLFVGVNQRLDSFSLPKTAATETATTEQSSTAPALTPDQIEALKEKVLGASVAVSGNE